MPRGNRTTGSQRYNARMDKVFREAVEARRNPVNKSHRRHNQKLSKKKK
jgi:hypothetical protein